MHAVARRICHALAAALDALGACARYRPYHDIVVDGRRIGCGGGAFESAALLYQGTLHLTLDAPALMRALRTPGNALAERALDAAHARMTDLATVLGSAADPALVKDRVVAALESEFAVEFQEADLSLSEHTRYRDALAEVCAPDWIDHVRRPAAELTALTAQATAPGALGASVLYDSAQQRIRQVWFIRDGKPALEPRFADLEAVLRDTSVKRLERNVQSFFAAHGAALRAFSARDFIAVLRRALDLPVILVGYPGEPRS
jgi:hypothetical protein